ncbi:PilN domain-containing protein [bacterium]|nr:PilN domain-containing protein [bacterium]
MIRINLIPPEDRDKKRDFHLPGMSTIYMVGVVVIVVGIMFTLGVIQHHKVSGLKGKIEEARKESKELAPQLAKIKKITKERGEVDRRLQLITSLDRYRYFRVKLLNDIGMKIPQNCWLTKITELAPNSYTIDGVAFNNYKVADMMTNLEASPVFTNVGLKVAEEGKIRDRNVMKFSLKANAMPQ